MYIGPVYDEMIDIHYAQKNLKIDTDLCLGQNFLKNYLPPGIDSKNEVIFGCVPNLCWFLNFFGHSECQWFHRNKDL